jgi:beta-RFAP synthase
MMTLTLSHNTDPGWLSVTAPARLHLGFVDLNGSLGRRFGSLGMALEYPFTRIIMRRSEQLSASGPDKQRALQYASTLLDQLNLSDAVEVMIEQTIPAHSGLGSGTQLALAIGSAISHLFELDLTAQDIARRLGRGDRSGIGIGAFEQGGFLVDGGRGAATGVPPLIARLPVPEAWRILLIFDRQHQGIYGMAEQRAFAELPEFFEHQAGEMCRLLVMQVLPALAEADIDKFGQAISLIQYQIGNYFAPLQGGKRFFSSSVEEVLKWLSRQGICGVGQSSWGPTGFAVIPDEMSAQRLLGIARQHWRSLSHLTFVLCKPRNGPGEVKRLPAAMAVSRIRKNVRTTI